MDLWTSLRGILGTLATLTLGGLGGCLAAASGGCVMDASALAGFSNPSLRVKHSVLWGTEVQAGTDFAGNGHLVYRPETGELEVTLDVQSDASGVVTAEGLRADHLVELRRIEAERVIELHRLVGENLKAAGTMLALAAAGGGEAVAKIADAVAPVLKGSAAELNFEGLGGGRVNLGEAEDGGGP